jgi:hypothetical protein
LALVPFCGVGVVGSPIDGVHAERVAAARAQGAA